MRNLSQKQKEAVQKLRLKVADLNLDDERNSDDYLVRWLIAQDMSFQKAEEMLRNSLKWREENNIDSILDWDPPEIYKKMYPFEVCGYTYDGIPVIVTPSKFIDMTLIWELDAEDYTRYWAQIMEKTFDLGRKMSKNGYTSYEFIAIHDLGDFNLRSAMNRKYLNLMRYSSKVLYENYPETLRKAFFVYTPLYFNIMVGLCKPFIPKQTLYKFDVCGGDPLKIKEYLSPIIPVEAFPPRYGGLNVKFENEAFKNCGRMSISRRLSINNQMEIDGFMECTVDAGRKEEFTFDIDEPDMILEWSFKTENYDIGFSIQFTKDASSIERPEILRQHQRVESHVHMQKGTIVCKRIGKYTLTFDNVYSKLRPKVLHLRVDIMKVEDEVEDEIEEERL